MNDDFTPFKGDVTGPAFKRWLDILYRKVAGTASRTEVAAASEAIATSPQVSDSTKEDKVNKSTDPTLADDSHVKYPSQLAVKTYVNRKTTAKRNGVTLFGDSLTYGSASPTTAWGPSLEAAFAADYPDANVEIINKGVPANNTTDLLARIIDDVIDCKRQIVVLQIGTNDSSDYKPVDIDTYEANMRSIITQIEDSNKKVILMVPPGIWEGAPSWITDYSNAKILPYQEKIRDLAAELHLDLVDNSQIPQDAIHFDDGGVHLTDAGYALIFQNVMPVLLLAFGYVTKGGFYKTYGDSETGFQFLSSDDTPIVNIDTENKKAGVNTITPQVLLHVHASTEPTGTDFYTSATSLAVSNQDNTAAADFVTADSTATAGIRGIIRGIRARGTLETPLVPEVDDYVFSVIGGIWDGLVVRNTAQIDLKVDGAVSSNIAPQRIVFSTRNAGAGAFLERLVIKNDGNVGVGVSDPSTTLEAGGVIKSRTGGFIGELLAFSTSSGATSGKLTSTSHATKGSYALNAAGTIVVDEANTRFSVGVASPPTTAAVYVRMPGGLGLVVERTTTTGTNTAAAVSRVTYATTQTATAGFGPSLSFAYTDAGHPTATAIGTIACTLGATGSNLGFTVINTAGSAAETFKLLENGGRMMNGMAVALTASKVLTNDTSTGVLDISLANTEMICGWIEYCAHSTNGTDMVIHRGRVSFAATSKGGVQVADIAHNHETGTSDVATGGATLTDSVSGACDLDNAGGWGIQSGTGKITIKYRANASITGTGYPMVKYTINLQGTNTMTPL